MSLAISVTGLFYVDRPIDSVMMRVSVGAGCRVKDVERVGNTFSLAYGPSHWAQEAPSHSVSGSSVAPFFSNGGVPKTRMAFRARSVASTVGDALDFQPTLSNGEKLLTLASSGVLSCGVYLLLSQTHAAGKHFARHCIGYSALAFGLAAFLIYVSIIERKFRKVGSCRRAEELAKPNSRFLNVDGAKMHVTVEKPSDKCIDGMVHCVHGFGSHTFSFSFIQKRLAERLKAIITAHDMCGFGLSERSKDRKKYSMYFNGAACKDIMNKVEENEFSELMGNDHEFKRKNRILIGHSMGASAVAEAVIADGNCVDAIVLIAPAIVCLWSKPSMGLRKNSLQNTFIAFFEALLETEDPTSSVMKEGFESFPKRTPQKVAASIGYSLGRGMRAVVSLVQGIITEIVRLTFVLVRPLILAFMHALVFPREFWRNGLAIATVDQNLLTTSYVDSYRLPVLIKGWDVGILRFVDARIAEKAGLWHAITQFLHPERTMLQAERLRDVCIKNDVQVLVVHGANDLLVPVTNSKRLVKSIPNAQLVVFDNCGHMPHEEQPDKFVDKVLEFIESNR